MWEKERREDSGKVFSLFQMQELWAWGHLYVIASVAAIPALCILPSAAAPGTVSVLHTVNTLGWFICIFIPVPKDKRVDIRKANKLTANFIMTDST